MSWSKQTEVPWVGVDEVRQRTVEARTRRHIHPVAVVIGFVIEHSNDDEALAASQGIKTALVVDPTWLSPPGPFAEKPCMPEN